jgi:hypothetical protein
MVLEFTTLKILFYSLVAILFFFSLFEILDLPIAKKKKKSFDGCTITKNGYKVYPTLIYLIG